MIAIVVKFITNIITGMRTANSRLTWIGDLHQVEVGRVEAGLLVVDAVEGADDADAREALAEHEVDPVDLLLDGAEEGEALDRDRDDDGGEDRDDHDDDPGEARVLGQRP